MVGQRGSANGLKSEMNDTTAPSPSAEHLPTSDSDRPDVGMVFKALLASGGSTRKDQP